MTFEEQSMIRRQQVSNFRASGQTAAVWCSENNLSVNTLRYWLTKCKREDQADSKQDAFVELKQSSVKEGPDYYQNWYCFD